MTFKTDKISTPSLYAAIEDDLASLSEALQASLSTDNPFFSELNRHVLANPGKRLRPALLFLAGKMLSCVREPLVTYAVIYELIHTATLIHDDVIDEAEKRRGLASLNHVQGNTISVLYGDLLYTKANSLAVASKNLEVLDLICRVTQGMIEGEILQERWNFDLTISEQDYFEILIAKTALLFAATMETAGHVAGLNEEQRDALHQYGYNLGISFQLIDDYLDYAGNEQALGKPVLSDLREGKVTLPVIRLLAREPKTESLIRRCWSDHEDDAVLELRRAVIEHESLQETWELGRRYAEQACSFLVHFPDNTFRQMLAQVPELMLSRMT